MGLERAPRWWQWPTVLSLDAPAVAVAWQAMLFAIAGRGERGAPLFVLGASVWLAYAADRWIEGWRLHPSTVRTQRHSFYQRRRWAVAVLWVLVLGLDVFVAVTGLGRREFVAGALLIAPVAAYLLSHQLIHRHHRWRLPKEICVALLLAGGIFVFPAAAAHGRLLRLAEPTAVFVILAFANCGLISVWEHAVDRSHGQTSLALQFHFGSALGRWAAGFAVALGVAGWAMAHGAVAAANAAGAASGLLLLALDQAESKVGWEAARVLADAVLLTPVAAILWRTLAK